MERRVRVAAAHALDEGRCRIVVVVALLVVRLDALADDALHEFLRQSAARRRQHGRHLFEKVQRHARIAACKLGNRCEDAILGREMLCAEAALLVAQSLL